MFGSGVRSSRSRVDSGFESARSRSVGRSLESLAALRATYPLALLRPARHQRKRATTATLWSSPRAERPPARVRGRHRLQIGLQDWRLHLLRNVLRRASHAGACGWCGRPVRADGRATPVRADGRVASDAGCVEWSRGAGRGEGVARLHKPSLGVVWHQWASRGRGGTRRASRGLRGDPGHWVSSPSSEDDRAILIKIRGLSAPAEIPNDPRVGLWAGHARSSDRPPATDSKSETPRKRTQASVMAPIIVATARGM